MSRCLPPPAGKGAGNAGGEAIYHQGIAERGLPACASCHGVSGEGIGQEFPRLAGQEAKYLKAQLKEFRAGSRDSAIMNAAATALQDEEIDAVAEYLFAL